MACRRDGDISPSAKALNIFRNPKRNPSRYGEEPKGSVADGNGSRALGLGNKLNSADKYRGVFHTRFTPAGYGIYKASALSTWQFTCPSGTGNCYFY